MPETTTLSPTDYDRNWKAHARCGEAQYVGYYVIRTIDADGHVLAEPEVIAHVEGGHRYAEALELARQHRTTGKGEWAVIGGEYDCGHVIR